MAPLVRRTWAPRGQRPVLRQRGKHREKVSLAAALCWSPAAPQPLRLVFESLANGYFNNERSAAFVESVVAQIGGPVIVLWDGGSMHKGDPVRQALGRLGGQVELERLPPYAPMLNPVEPLWSWLKYSQLCNFAAADALELQERAEHELHAIRHDHDFLRMLWHASDLPVPRALLM
jgi:transposase